jgi:hypothetical protein
VKAQAGCDKGITAFAKDEAAFDAGVAKACGPSSVDPSRLLGTTGLGFGGLATTCTSLGVGVPSDAASVATCVARIHACRSDAALGFEAPRAAELLALVGHGPGDLPCLPSGSGAGGGLGDVTRGKLAAKCEQAVKKAGAKLLGVEMKSLQKCALSMFTCI